MFVASCVSSIGSLLRIPLSFFPLLRFHCLSLPYRRKARNIHPCRITGMHSPLPDSSALEAGILEDERPSRISRVQDNVRNLLRASVFSSIRGSTLNSPIDHHATVEDDVGSSTHFPRNHHVRIHPDALRSPLSETTASTTAMDINHVPGVLFPPTAYQQQVQEMAHQSTMFNTRAIAALIHPDMSDPALALFLQQKTESRQQRAWKRSRNRKLRHASAGRKRSHWLLCVVAGLLLAAVVATCESIRALVYT